MVTVTAQFTAKMTNSEKTVYFLSLMSCSINKLKPVFRFYVKKQFAPGNSGGGGPGASPFPYRHVIADIHTGFCSKLLWKHELNVRSSHRNSSVKKGILRNFTSFTGKHLCWSLILIELPTFRSGALLKRDSNTDVFLWNLQNF